MNNTTTSSQNNHAAINNVVWMTCMPGKIRVAQLSGDAHAIAVVCHDDDDDLVKKQQFANEQQQVVDDDDGENYGVHVMVRDWEDGSEKDWSLSSSKHKRKSGRRRHVLNVTDGAAADSETINVNDAMPEFNIKDTPLLSRSRSIGVVYKPGPFLVHPSPVTRLVFRGHGHNTSSECGARKPQQKQQEGNDLLLTYCEESLSARIFCQNGWKCFMEWDTPVRTRVDWIHGVSAFTLGDLEPKSSNSKYRSSSAPSSRRPSLNNSNKNDGNTKDESDGRRQHYQSIPNHATPYSNAGAWISEITFQDATPAIRLSRLTYLKRGVDEFIPTLFENVSAILPVGLISPNILCGNDDSYLCVEGIWPVWNPRLSEASSVTTDHHTGTIRGSAMSFLGLAAGPAVSTTAADGSFTDGLLSNTQSPPCEIRIVAAHAEPGKLLALQFPLLGEQDWTALELGNPTRSIFLLDELDIISGKKRNVDRLPLPAVMELESSQLIAQYCEEASKFISLTWRKHGPAMFLPSHWMPEDVDSKKAARVLTERRWFKDESILSVPIEQPVLWLPPTVCKNRSVVEMRWWKGENVGGPHYLIVLLDNGTIIVFEIASPESVERPVVLCQNAVFPDSPIMKINTMSSNVGEIYEVSIVPDTEFGLGLRLEVQQDGNPAIVGSFKRNPLSGDILPAEQCGVIALGDELVNANNVNLEEKLFDDIIATVRDIGAVSGVGNPMRLTFRRMSDPQPPPSPRIRQRRTAEQILGVKPADSNGNTDGLFAASESVLNDCQEPLPPHFSVVAVFEKAIQELVSGNTRPRHDGNLQLAVVPHGSQTKVNFERSCILYYTYICRVSAVHLELRFFHTSEKARISYIGSWQKDSDNQREIRRMDVKCLDQERTELALCDVDGTVSLLQASLHAGASPSIKFQHYDLFCIQSELSRNVQLRLFDVTLLATMPTEDGFRKEITVWSLRADPYTSDTVGQPECCLSLGTFCYHPSSIRTESSDNDFVDFEFVNSGYLDAFPTLVVFSKRHVTAYSRQGLEWLPAIRMSYQSFHEAISAAEVSQGTTFYNIASPRTAFSHLTRSLRLGYVSESESDYLCADWHPESMIASVMTEARGPLHALRERVRPLLLWLSTEGLSIQEGNFAGRLYTAPLFIYTGFGEKDRELTAGATADIGLEKDKMLKLLTVLVACCSTKEIDHAGYVAPLRYSPSLEAVDLPQPLLPLSVEDMHILRSFCTLMVDSHDYQFIDPCGQHFIFCASIIKALHIVQPESHQVQYPPKSPLGVPGLSPRLHMSVPNQGADSRQISSAACLAALLSCSQSQLLKFSRTYNEKMDWKTAKRLRLPFWVRSDTALARISEEIGQNLFRSERDIMESALYYIIAQKTLTLRNLAATDSSENGRKFHKFLNTFDFSTEKGRRAAEKNGFSLLRKCKYRAASAFFLLAKPPFLNAAVATIATKMKDIDLAFLVARLMESDKLASAGSFNLAAIGGGGGYVNSTASNPIVGPDESFAEWVPRLGKSSQSLLVERAFASTADRLFSALSLVWLGKKDDATWVCADIVRPDDLLSVAEPAVLERYFARGAREDGVVSASRKLNALIDDLSPPLLLRAMAGSRRSQLAAALTISQTLEGRGVELASIDMLFPFGKEHIPEEHHDVIKLAVPATSLTNQVQTSIFDSFDMPPQRVEPPTAVASSTIAQSSIFDDFDIPLSKAKPLVQSQVVNEMQSSIFDSYDTLPREHAADNHAISQSVRPTKPIEGDSDMPTALNGRLGVHEDTTTFDLPSVNGLASPPALWSEWTLQVLVQAAARRFVREVAGVLAPHLGDLREPRVDLCYVNFNLYFPSGAFGAFQEKCDGHKIIQQVRQTLNRLCAACDTPDHYVVEAALRFLNASHSQHRMLLAVVINAAVDREHISEDILRVAAQDLIGYCNVWAITIDDLVHQRKSKAHVASQYIRRYAARVSYQVETCLWLHRGGGLPLSGIALKEAIVGVRAGLLVVSWNRNYECIETMIRSNPDCCVDEEAGRILWASLKSNVEVGREQHLQKEKVSSGGWEFLVECKRSEATGLLNDKKTGCFIIRPHPGDSGVYTLSFKTNLIPPKDDASPTLEEPGADNSGDDLTDSEATTPNRIASTRKNKSRNNQSVQHAIVRLSESGYRCGSFGPHTTLISLLEAVSASLPFALRFDLPPTDRLIKEEGSQPSPNAVLFRELGLGRAACLRSAAPDTVVPCRNDPFARNYSGLSNNHLDPCFSKVRLVGDTMSAFGKLLELLVVAASRKQFSDIVAADYRDILPDNDGDEPDAEKILVGDKDDNDWRTMDWRRGTIDALTHDRLMVAQTILAPILSWCKILEILALQLVDPSSHVPIVSDMHLDTRSTNFRDGGDSILRKMIQRDSGVHFSTLKLADGGDSTMVVIFSQEEAIKWLLTNNTDASADAAVDRLKLMEKNRIIESIDFSTLRLKHKVNTPVHEGTRYRILDPWEVEALQNWEGETLGASLGREQFSGFSLARVGHASESIIRSFGEAHVLELWTCLRGDFVTTKAIAAIHPNWESCGGGDLQFLRGSIAEPAPFENTIRQHLYRNSLFRRLEMPQRFMAIVQVELLDLKNLTAPGGLLSMSVYALLRLRREGSNAELTNKSRTLDTAITQPVKLGKATGPNAPASWGSVARFRFPLPEDAWVDGSSYDSDRDVLFKGPPRMLQVSVYEKKLLVDHCLGTADVRTDGLCAGGQLEEWVPLRNEKQGIAWFARVRLTLRFELMCLASSDEAREFDGVAPSVGLRKIQELGRTGGVSHEDMRKSVSSPDLVLTYFDSMVP
ncbi:hypothetical protein MPSEU_000107800 [Mayamaea pseudoterrestris]|nr:hypothetical protein MPSEU_000107800 [Mayamaea pseudoterrestris]